MSGYESLLTLKQAAERLGVSYSFIYRAYRAGSLPVVRISTRCIRIKESDVLLFIDARRIAQTIIANTEGRRKARDERARAAGLFVASDTSNSGTAS